MTEIDVEIISTMERTGINVLVASPIALCVLLSIIKASLLWESKYLCYVRLFFI